MPKKHSSSLCLPDAWTLRGSTLSPLEGPEADLGKHAWLPAPGDQFLLFVSYSSVDAVWTHGLTGRLEAELLGLRVCLHKRDFTPGTNVLENMAGCI